MPWWKENRMRMVQFNLVGTDAASDTDQLVAWLKDMHANTLLIGAGGMVSYYPSAIDGLYINPT